MRGGPIVLGFNGGAIILHWLAMYLEGYPQTGCSILFHFICPLIPFIATVIVIVISLSQGGICYIVEKETFWYKGCQLCDGIPAALFNNNNNDTSNNSFDIGNGGSVIDTFITDAGNNELLNSCPDGIEPTYGNYCGDKYENFCFFEY